MNLKLVRVVAGKEMVDLLRDRRTIISMVVIPVVAIPLLIAGISWFSISSMEKLQEKRSPVALLGAEYAGEQLELLRGAESIALREDLAGGRPADSLVFADGVKLVVEFGPRLPLAFEGLERGEAHPAGAGAATEEGVAEDLDGDEAGDGPAVNLYYDSTDDEARVATEKVVALLVSYREQRVRDWLSERGIEARIVKPWTVERRDIAPPKRKAADFVARFLPYLILILCLQGAMYPAMDLTAGEKERSTIETLLVNPVSRLDIVLGKYIATSVMALGSALFTLVSQLVFFRWLSGNLVEGMISLRIEPSAALAGLLLLLPVALMFAAVLLAISIFARSMKEAQSYVGPLMMLVIFPSMVSLIPGLKLSWATAFIPVFNVTLVMKSALLQDYSQVAMMAAVFLINAFYAVLALLAALRIFQREQVIFRS